jgi:HlyD family secretion protein
MLKPARVTCLVLLTILSSCGSDLNVANRTDADVRDRSAAVFASGVTEPLSEEITLSNRAAGVIVALPAAEGSQVVKGQVLARIEASDLIAQRAQAAARVELEEIALMRLENGARLQERQQVYADLRRVAAAEGMAQARRVRIEALAASGFVTKAAIDEARAQAASAKAERDRAAAAVSLIIARPRNEDAAAARARVVLARDELAQADALLDKTVLRSPIDGRVLRVHTRVGETVGSLQPVPIISVGDTSVLNIRADVDETDVGRVAIGNRAIVTFPGFPGKTFTGRVVRIANRLGPRRLALQDPTSRKDVNVLDALIRLDGQALPIPVGLRGDVTIIPNR